MRVGFVEWPDLLEPESSAWCSVAKIARAAAVDLLVTNELPFGRWLAAEAQFDPCAAQASVDIHNAGLKSLERLQIPAILSSRPVWTNGRLANEAYSLEGGRTRPLHRKRYFPAEPGWFETSWYRPGTNPFCVTDIAAIRVGTLLCTDLMFNEHARHYGRQGADLIAVPRAAGTSIDNWLAAGKMAAIVSGSYVVSSNRIGPGTGGVTFGGAGFAYQPDGSLFAVTSKDNPLVVIDIDTSVSAQQRRCYPCYVSDMQT
jgi:N-carbamoylputrescine amidase